jgi:hypothetical protein
MRSIGSRGGGMRRSMNSAYPAEFRPRPLLVQRRLARAPAPRCIMRIVSSFATFVFTARQTDPPFVTLRAGRRCPAFPYFPPRVSPHHPHLHGPRSVALRSRRRVRPEPSTATATRGARRRDLRCIWPARRLDHVRAGSRARSTPEAYEFLEVSAPPIQRFTDARHARFRRAFAAS